MPANIFDFDEDEGWDEIGAEQDAIDDAEWEDENEEWEWDEEDDVEWI